MKLNDRVLFQRDYRIPENSSIFEYSMKNRDKINPNDTIAVMSQNGELFELNLTAAIILEECISNKKNKEIAELLQTLFDVEESRVLLAIEKIIKEYLLIGVIINE